jgi:archaemetzincin
MRAASRWLLAIGVLTLTVTVATAQDGGPTPGVRARVHLVVIGTFPGAWIDPIAEALERDLDVDAVVEPAALPLPAFAYYAPRRRYRAERLLEHLNRELERCGRAPSRASGALSCRSARGTPQSERVLGLTSRDISTTTERFHDWGILGLADLGGRAAIVSSFRMRRRASGDRALWRMTTTAVHEVGHVLGLPHCDEPRCLMRDAEGTMDTVDAGDGTLGPSCRARLDREAPRSLDP